MYTNPILDDGQFIPISIEEIEFIEQKLDLCFPDFFKQFWLNYNGASPVRNCYGPINRFGTIDTFLVLKALPEDHYMHYFTVEKYYEVNREEMERPDYLMPFAQHVSGDAFFVSLLPSELGYVYQCYLEDDELSLIDTNFVDFINNLRPFIGF